MKSISILLYSMIFLTACSEQTLESPETVADAPVPSNDHVFETQVNTMEKAKELEQTLQEAADKRLEEVDQN